MQPSPETDTRVWRIAGLALAGLTVIAVILKAVGADDFHRLRAARRRGVLIDQTLFDDRRLAQIAAVVQKRADV